MTPPAGAGGAGLPRPRPYPWPRPPRPVTVREAMTAYCDVQGRFLAWWHPAAPDGSGGLFALEAP